MKKIGIIGGLSAQSTIEYYRILVERYNKIKGGNSSPKIVIDSLDLEEFSKNMIADNWTAILEILKKSIKDLIAAGAEILLLATNTPHKVYDQLVANITIPFPSIMKANALAIKSRGLKKVGLIGSIFTMNSEFYQKELKKYGIDVVVPDDEDKKVINEIIWKELTFHILTKDSKEKYLAVIDNLQAKGAEGVILGCTEIPLLIKQEDCEIPVFDTTTIHANYVLDLALK